jgi:hypothetical protein
MAQRMVRRAGIEGEEGVTVSFGFVSLLAAILLGVLEELGLIGDLASLALFSLHRIVLVTDEHTYVYKSRPFHRPGQLVSRYDNGPGTVERVRGKLTFADGVVVWHSPLFAWRAKAVEAAANVPSAAGAAALAGAAAGSAGLGAE